MRLIKFGLISIIVLFAVLTFVSFFFPSTVIVSRAVDINKPKDSLVGLVKDFNGWHQWIEGMDQPSVKIKSSTEANLAGTTVNIDHDSLYTVHSHWKSVKGMKMEGTINLISDHSGKITIVQWQFEQHIRWYPWEKLGSMMSDKILGTMMENNLARLKKLAESPL